MHEQHGWPEILGSITMAIILGGGLACLSGTVWGWAVGVKVVHGTIGGGAIGIVLGLFFGYLAGLQPPRFGRRSYSSAIGALVGGPLTLSIIIGLVVGIIRSAS